MMNTLQRITSRLACSALAITGLLALGACGNNDEPGTSTPAQSQLMIVHGAYEQAGTQLAATVDGNSALPVDYGRSSGYLLYTSGTRALKVTAGGASSATIAANLDINKSYSFFAGPGATAGTISSRLVADNLAVSTSQARVRFINLLGGTATNAELVLAPASGSGASQHVAYDSEAFTDFAPVITNLTVVDGNGQVLTQVGSGAGTGAGTRKYEAGHLYTIIVAGNPAATAADARPKAFVLVNL